MTEFGVAQTEMSNGQDEASSSSTFDSQMAALCAFVPSEVRLDLYREHLDVSKLSAQDVEEFRQSKEIVVEGVNVPNPIRHFREAGFSEFVLLTFKSEGFTHPSPIQCQGWPIALSGRDLIGIAETGSGKTLTFALPAIMHVEAQPPLNRGDGPIALALAPTRELAQQTQQAFEKYGRRLRSCCVYGGVPRGPQQRELQSGVEMVIATPGRLLDFLGTRTTNLRRVSFLVFDEADKMLDMGLFPHISDICSRLPSTQRQTMMFTATWTDDVQLLARQYLSNSCIKVKIGSSNLTANRNIEQTVYVVQEDSKADQYVEICYIKCVIFCQLFLCSFLHVLNSIYRPEAKILVFAGTRKKADALSDALQNAGSAALCLHGDKSQAERDHVLQEFRSGRIPLIVATDVAARGLDIKGVEYVINFDMPLNVENYIHRIGRTGRAGSFGKAISFFTNEDEGIAWDLVSILDEAQQRVDPVLRDIGNRVRIRLASKEERASIFTKRKNRFSNRAEPYSAQLISRIASAPPTEPTEAEVRSSFGDLCEVILLRNLVGPGEVDADLKADVHSECSKYGVVKNLFIHEVTHWSIKAEEAAHFCSVY